MPVAIWCLLGVAGVALLGFSVFNRFSDDRHEAFSARLSPPAILQREAILPAQVAK